MDSNNEKGRVEKLNETLYSRTRYKDPSDTRAPVEPSEHPEVEESWQSPNLDQMLMAERRPQSQNTFMKKIFLLAVVFFMSALVVTGYIFFGGANFVSSKNVDVTILGPTNVSAGDALELGITVTNRNNADLETTNLSIQYPTGTRNAEDTSRSLTYERFELGVVSAGEEVLQNTKAVIFGEVGEVKEIKIRVEYKIKGSSATFFREKIYEITIGKTPIVMVIDMPESVTSGETFTTRLELTLNSEDILRNIMVRAEYPYGYSVTSSSPLPSGSDNLWSVGDFSSGDKKTIEIQGQLIGEDEEERTFRFYIGVGDAEGGTSFKTVIATMHETLAISRPSIGLNIEFQGDSSSTYMAPAAKAISSTIRFQNNLPDKVLNPKVEVRFSGSALDRFSIRAGSGGLFDSENNRIIWNLTNSLGERVLLPGDDGRLSFSFSSLANLPLGSQNEEIKLTATFTGSLVAGSKSTQLGVTETRTVKISSQVALASKSLYSKGPFTNRGPIPPKAEEETTYTIVFGVSNTRNDVRDALVTAKLGPNVKWLLAADTPGENISYNENSNTVTWDIGTLASGAGFSSAGREVSFQVSLVPSIGQIGTAPLLASNIIFTGVDSFTNSPVTASNTSVTTRTASDPNFVQGDDIVAK